MMRQGTDAMTRIIIDLPEPAVQALREPDTSADESIRMAAAVKLFEIGRVSSGVAAEIAGMSRPVFLQRLGDYGVASFDLAPEEVRRELGIE